MQITATYAGEAAVLEAKGRHDSCVLPRATPLVEGMTALVLADAALRCFPRPLHVMMMMMMMMCYGMVRMLSKQLP
jgi:chorismate synthase